MSAENPPSQAVPRMLDAIAGSFTTRRLLEAPHGAVALEEARARAALTIAAGEAAAELAIAPFAGALLVASLAGADPPPEDLRLLVAELSDAGLAPLALLRAALCAPALMTLDPAEACHAALGALAVCAPLRHVAVFSPGAAGSVERSARAGGGSCSPAALRLARAVLAGEDGTRGRGEMLALPILRSGRPAAALVARGRRGARARALAFLVEASAPLAAILEREALLASSAAGERLLLQASERRLTRLGYDLHDGPLQELLLVGEDLALFRRQLAVVLEGRRGNELLGGRLDDLDARLVALERGLRGISSSVHSDVLVTQPFRDALHNLFGPFAARSGIDPTLECEGDLDSITTSQRLAVLSVVGEALNNVREHGEASAVHVAIAHDRDGLRASVRDDGRGFDVERELLRAARGGRMGLAGMHERVRLLDGRCRVESRPGGPTEVMLALPRWQALPAAGDSAERVGTPRARAG